MLKHACAVVFFALVTSSAFAKGPITRIDIGGDGLSTPLKITDPSIVSAFSIWNGPCVRSSTRGRENPPAHLDSSIQDGRFIDWPRGLATRRPANLQRLEVTFHIRGSGIHTVAYEIDPARGQGYIYVPEQVNSLIYNGVEGNWLFASKRWDEMLLPLIAASTDDPLERNDDKFSCKVGRPDVATDVSCWPERDSSASAMQETARASATAGPLKCPF